MNKQARRASQSGREEFNRRRFLRGISSLGVGAALFPGALAAVARDKEKITVEMITQAEKIAGLEFADAERQEIVEDLNRFRDGFESLRDLHMANSVPLSLYFNPVPPGKKLPNTKRTFRIGKVRVKNPESIEAAAFYPLTHLAKLLKSRRITSEALTKMYLSRLKKYDAALKCVVTLTEELALEQARRADEEIKAGRYRGLLHGIPWGVKDIFSTKGYRTTWGASIYRDQVFAEDATVVKRLEEAGAVLLAKLSVGELATGDRWFGGQTRNPWNPEWPSGGSSAGPAAATAAGLVGFAVGTETTASLVGPAWVCGATALRPSFGRVSRNGVMTVSWSFDKVGPIGRTVEDCAVVFNAIHGRDGIDHSVLDVPFNWDHTCDVSKLRIGFIEAYLTMEPKNEAQGFMLDSYKDACQRLKKMGITLVPVEKPSEQWNKFGLILVTEAAAAHDELTLSGKDKLLTNSPWASTFRKCRFIPAVEYIQANRARTLRLHEVDKLFGQVDVLLGSFINFANLVGLPEVVIPYGFNKYGMPNHISFTGRLFGEEEILSLACAVQEATDYHLRHPQLG
jgi:Asp-tRNA(Asn)/Glu-tRNA(Gln) amidotransferase A subunit family amidase